MANHPNRGRKSRLPKLYEEGWRHCLSNAIAHVEVRRSGLIRRQGHQLVAERRKTEERIQELLSIQEALTRMLPDAAEREELNLEESARRSSGS